jgi:hypothetical protein
MLLLKTCAALISVLFMGGVVALGVGRHAQDEPLDAYLAVTQRAQAIDDRSCFISISPLSRYDDGEKNRWCDLEGEGFPPARVTVYYEGDMLTHMVAFSPPPNSLRYGDLVECWGPPNEAKFVSRQLTTEVLSVSWDGGISASIRVPHGAAMSYLHPVSYLALETALPCGSGE